MGVPIGLCAAQSVIEMAHDQFPVTLEQEEVQKRHGVPAAGDAHEMGFVRGELRVQELEGAHCRVTLALEVGGGCPGPRMGVGPGAI